MIKPANEFWIKVLRKKKWIKKKKRHVSTKANCEIYGHKVASGDQKF